MDPAGIFPDELDDAACKRALAVLVDVGTALALECKTPSPDASLAERSKAFERVSLAVRRTVLLFEHLKAALVSPEIRQFRGRKAIIREVEDTIDREAKPADAAALRVELVERLDSPDFAQDLAHRSPGELILELCNDLGLTTLGRRPRHRRRTPDDIAILCAQAAAPANSRRTTERPLPGAGWANTEPPDQTSPPPPH